MLLNVFTSLLITTMKGKVKVPDFIQFLFFENDLIDADTPKSQNIKTTFGSVPVLSLDQS